MNKRLFVGGIPFSTSKDELISLFSQFGPVTSVDIITDKFTGQPKGFGFVEMETEDGAKAAAEKLNGYELGGRKLAVAEAKPMEPKRYERHGFSDRGGGGFKGRREGGRGSFGRDNRGGGGRRGGGYQGRGGR